MRNFHIMPVACLSPAKAPVEIVERKGLGHPDTICDALAEALSLALCRYYRDHFGLVFHHNVDKALLWGGTAKSTFNGGQVIAPMEIFLAGRATCEVKGRKIPVEELVVETSRQWLRENLRALDADRHVKLHAMVRPGSADLVELYLRQQTTGKPLANDTSCGVGYAPLDDLEQLVLEAEQHLNSPSNKTSYPFIGEDIKVMGVRQGEQIDLTVACAFIDRHVKSVDDYLTKKRQVADLTTTLAARITPRTVNVTVNSADDPAVGSLYLTVTGTSAEAGDDGEVGRGNRVNGLIAPYRPMNMEAAAGKNPVTHVGKIYNIVAQRIAAAAVAEIDEVEEAQCYLVSRIGQPIAEPQVVDLRVQTAEKADMVLVESRLQEITQHHLSRLRDIQDQLIGGAIRVY